MSTDPSHMSGGAPILPAPTEEPRYTLAEARQIINEETCAAHGHDLTFITDFRGDVVRSDCSRCGGTWRWVRE